MDDKTIIDITNLDAENAAKRVASYSEKLLHHASILSEKEYQKFLLERLEKDNGYVIRKASNFDRYFAVDREMLFKFLEDTQHETMEYLRKIYKSDLEETIVSFINAETTKARGSLLDVLKHGIEISNQKLELMYTKPATTFNPNLTRKYGQNIFSAMEEVWASDKERIDVVIFLNGLAIIAFELKCNAAGQSYQDAIYQFRTDRSPKTRLFMFKAGTLVNFAMDLEEVYMTTKLAGDATFFLPFNMGNGEGVTAGAGNPAFEDKYSVSYMWEDILTKDTILDLISKFIFVETKERVDDKTGKIKRSENLIFPRYHQLDVIRKVLADVRENRTAQNYLIQHSAGSGKTNSIAWLAHRLTSLHDKENKIIFDNIIIVTDRVVVDRQLQKRLTFFLQKSKKLLEHYEYETQRQAVADMRGFVRYYEFLLQVSSFEDTDLHKKYNFISYLLAYINIKHPGGGFNLDGKIKASQFVQKKGEEHVSSDLVAKPVMKLPTAEHFGLSEDKEKRLSEIIDEINSKTGKNYDNDVVVKAMLQIRDILMKSDKLKTSAKNNTQQDFEFSYFDDIDDALIEGLSQNQDFFSMLLSNDEMKHQVMGIFSDEIYKSLRESV